MSFFLAACSGGREDDSVVSPGDVMTADQRQLAGIRTGRIEYRLVSPVVSCTGEVEVPPQSQASVTAPLGGYILDANIVPGEYVKKGAILARLNNPEYISLQQGYLETLGQLRFASKEFERQRSLVEQNAAAQKKFQESESSYDVLKARLAGLKERLRMIGVDMRSLEEGHIQPDVALRAPITGFVTAVNHHRGQFVEPREVSFHIVDLSDLHLHLNVFETDVAKVRKGQLIRFRLAGGGGETFLGEISLISPQGSEDMRTFDVHGHIEDNNDMFRPGMFVEAEIVLSRDSLYALPETAVVTRNGKSFVVWKSDGGYRVDDIDTGVAMDGWVEIRNHNAFKDREIVVEGASRVFAALEKG